MNFEELISQADYTLGHEDQPFQANQAGVALIRNLLPLAERARAAMDRAYAGCCLLGALLEFPWIREVRLVVAGDLAIDDNGRAYTYAEVEAKDLVLDLEALGLLDAGADRSQEVLLEQIEDWLDDFSWEVYEGFGGDEHELADVVIRLQRSLLSELPVEQARSGGRLAALLDERGLISIGGDPVAM